MANTLRIEVSSAHNPSAVPDASGQYPIEVIRQRLEAATVYNPAYRYNDTLDRFEFYRVSDGAWIDAATVDPRKVTVFPALTGANRRCNSAHSFRWWLQNRYIPLLLDIINAGATVAYGASLIVAALAQATTINYAYFISLALDIVAAALTQGAAAISAAMTTTVYNQFECILYCRMDADGRMSASQFGQARADVLTTFSGDAESILIALMTLGDAGSINALAAQGFDAGHCATCSTCTDWTHTFDFTVNNGGFVPVLPAQAVYVPGVGWSTVDFTNSGTMHSRLAYIYRTIPGAATITSISYTFSYVPGTFSSPVDKTRVDDDVTTIATSSVAIVAGLRSFAWTGSRFMGTFRIMARSSFQVAAAWNGSATIKSCTVTGTGIDPFT